MSWGDTPDAVMAAVGDRAVHRAGRPGEGVYGLQLQAERQTMLANVPVVAGYFFDERGRLLAIRLRPPAPAVDTCTALVDAARQIFGAGGTTSPFQVIGTGTRTIWRDRPNDRFILALDVPWLPVGSAARLCHVTIQPYGDGETGDRRWPLPN